MEDVTFTHLHVHSDYSILDGYGTIDEYIQKAKSDGQKAIALTDHNSMLGISKFLTKCKKNDIKPIAGIEINMAPEHPLGAKNKDYVNYGGRQVILNRGANVHLTLLAKNYQGLKNLYKLIHLSYKEENFFVVPRIDLNILKEYSSNLICLSGCPNSEINIRFRLNQDDKAYEYASQLKEIFKDDFYIEIMPYKTVLGYSIPKLLKLAKELNIKPVLTNDVHYTFKEDSEMQDKMMALSSNSKMSETPTYKGGTRYSLGGSDRYFKTTEEMKNTYKYSEMPELITNIQEIVDKVEIFDLEYDSHLRPKIEIPSPFKTNIDYLKHLITEGFKQKRGNATLEVKKESKKRINHELNVVIANDFVDYFLVVWDYCKWANDNGVPTGAGRGSGAASEIMYLLDVHRTDPIRFDLIFERFISPGRGATYQITYEDDSVETINIANQKDVNGTKKYIHELQVGDVVKDDSESKKIIKIKIIDAGSPPDVDTDFKSEGREKVIQYIINKYGATNVASIMTPGPFKVKNAFKSICTIESIPFSVANKISEYLPDGIDKNVTIGSLINKDGKDYEQGADLRAAITSDEILNALKSADKLYGRQRETGVHPCGIVISSQALDETIPQHIRQEDGLPVTQWNYAECEALGLIKMDFLGLDTIDLIYNTIDFIKQTKGISVDLNELINGDLKDEKTMKLFQYGNTYGIFQFGKSGVQELLKKVHPTEFTELAAITALYRPGPMGLNLHLDFAERKNNEDARIPVHKKFYGTPVEEILKPTLNALVYQEQIMKISQAGASFTAQEADKLRKAIGKKDMKLMLSLEEKFKKGMLKNKYGKEETDFLWNGIVGFGEYCFNAGHSHAYALNSYQSAYLKANYPVEFMAALLHSKVKDAEASTVLAECTKMGIKVSPPNINESGLLITPSKTSDTIYYGLSYIKGINSKRIESIIEERDRNGKYKDLQDLIIRNQETIKGSMLRDLAISGALDCFGFPRKQIAEKSDELYKKAVGYDKITNMNSMFDMFQVEEDSFSTILSNEEYSFEDYSKNEAELTGLYLSSHPVDNLPELGRVDLNNLSNQTTVYATFSKIIAKKGRDKQTFYIAKVDNKVSQREFKLYKNITNRLNKYLAMQKSNNDVYEAAKLLGIKDQEFEAFTNIKPLQPLQEHKAYKITFTINSYSGAPVISDIEEVIRDNNGGLAIIKNVKYKNKEKTYIKEISKLTVKGTNTLRLMFPDGTYTDISNVATENFGSISDAIDKIEEK